MLVIDNNSGEIAPADTLPLPESKLAADTTLVFGNKKYGMATDYGIGRFGIKNKTEVYLQLYNIRARSRFRPVSIRCCQKSTGKTSTATN